MRFTLFILLGLFLSGCSGMLTSDLGQAKSVPNNLVSVTDKRPAQEKKLFKPGPLSPIILLGDENIKPSPISHLVSYLYEKKPSNVKTVNLEIEKFRLAHYYPASMSAAIGGALAGNGFLTGFETDSRKDQILGKLSGKLNGRRIYVEAATPYNAFLATTAPISNSEEYKRAMRATLSKLAERAWEAY